MEWYGITFEKLNPDPKEQFWCGITFEKHINNVAFWCGLTFEKKLELDKINALFMFGGV